jgi:hypothetical protein
VAPALVFPNHKELDLIDGSYIACLYRDSSYCLPASNEEKAIMLYEDRELSVWKYEDL